jgi:hypothetical protein
MDSQSDKFHTKMASSPLDDELFSHTLTEEDDAQGFDHPWNPWSLVMLTFFFGITAGGGLLAFNYQRLGIKGRLYSTIAIALIVEILLTAMHVWTIQSGLIDSQNRNDMRTFRLGAKVVSVLVATIIAYSQQKRFRLFGRSDLPAGNLLKPALIAIAAGSALDLLESAIILPVFLDRQ